MHWNKEDRQWIHRMDELFTNLFGPDYCEYEYTEKTKHCVVVAGQFPLIQYQHQEWEKTFKNDIPSPVPQQYSRTATKVKLATEHQTRSDIAGTAPQHVNNNAYAAIGSPKAAATPQQHGSSSTATMASVTSAATTAPSVINSTEATPVERSTKQFDRIRATKPPDSAPSNQNLLLRLDRVNLLTRGEIAALVLPRVASISNDDIMLALDQTEVKDPLSVSLRPSESAVEHALKLFREDSKRKNVGPIDVDSDDDCDDKAIVTLGRLGTFSKESVGVFQTMCTVASMAARVREEQRWFSNGNRSLPGHLDEVRDVLLNSRPKEEIIRQGTCIMDATDFSTLACERYVNGFAIDTICSKFLEDSKPVEIVFLPSFSQAWAMQGARYFSQMVRPFFGHCAVNSAKYILSPLHFDTPQHWGVLCFDTANQTVYFDDGLKLSPPRDTIVIVKNMLSGFKWLSDNDIFHEQEWNQPKLALPLPRINMPRQTSTGQGAASCGIGVILSVRDVIKNQTCPAPFQWVFEEMSTLRKELMTLVLQWKK